jgi:glycosyltransferase involved in cell wall biosynthesis
MPKISIIIPALNEEKFLPLLLDSVSAQTFKDFEVIVADAGSKDKTRDIALSFGARVVDGGMPGPGRNRGAEVAQGEFLFFFDSDVVLPPDFLEKAHNEMQEKLIDVATCEFKPMSELQLDRILFQLANLTVKLNQSWNPRAAGFCIFITKRLFERIGGFDETVVIAEDHNLVERATKYRPLHFLTSTYLTVSIRRLEKEGRFSLIEKYFHVEMHLLTKGSIRKDIIEYEFGSFSDDEKKQGKKILDEIEGRIIKFEQRYKDMAKTAKDVNEKINEVRGLWKENLQAIGNSFVNLFEVKP